MNRDEDWSNIQSFVSKSIMGDIQPSDFEKFPLDFYAFKAKLYRLCGMEKTTIGSFFRGMYMGDTLKTYELHLKSDFQFHISQKSSVSDIKRVVLRRGNTETDISQWYVTLYIGKDDTHHDSLIIFPDDETLFRLECKHRSTINGSVPFNGDSHDAFKHEQDMANKSPCKLKYNVFVFITNGKMSLPDNRKHIVEEESMFVSKERWTDTFSMVFEFFKEYEYTNDTQSDPDCIGVKKKL
jgi:hypothetical protein